MAAKNPFEKFAKKGLPIGKVVGFFNDVSSSFSDRDCWNHFRNLQSKNLKVGDAQTIFNFCKQKQVENLDFVYVIQCDDEARKNNIF